MNKVMTMCRLATMMVIGFFSQIVQAENYYCRITELDKPAVTGIPVVVAPQSSVLYLFGQNILHHRIYYFNEPVSLLDMASEKTLARPEWYNDSKFVAISRVGQELSLQMYLGQIVDALDIEAGVKYRRFSQKGRNEETFTDQNLSVHCELR